MRRVYLYTDEIKNNEKIDRTFPYHLHVDCLPKYAFLPSDITPV